MIKFRVLFLSVGLVTGCSTTTKNGSELGYQGFDSTGKSVQETLSELKSDPSVKLRSSHGWTIVTSDSDRIVWSFAPETHPAFPSFVKREVKKDDKKVYIETSVRCGAEKNVCDALVQDFIDLNTKVRSQMRGE